MISVLEGAWGLGLGTSRGPSLERNNCDRVNAMDTGWNLLHLDYRPNPPYECCLPRLRQIFGRSRCQAPHNNRCA